jgi:hypothetical protein
MLSKTSVESIIATLCPPPPPLHNLSDLLLTLYSEPGQGLEGGRATYCNSRVRKVGEWELLAVEMRLRCP